MFPSSRSEVVPIRVHRLPQSIETPVSFVSAPGVYVRFAYARSSDSMNNHSDGQDYLCFQHNDQRLAFVVCDGVGSSFCGNLAARILGDYLLEWLWSVDVSYLESAAAISEAASSALNKLQKQARHDVETYEIPGLMSPLVKQALEAQRAYGSETVFAAARIDYPGPTIPDGLVVVCWMGDTQIHALDEDGQPVSLGGRFENANRWSSTQGVRGQMSAWLGDLTGIGRVTAFTDGLAAHAKHLLDFSDDRLDQEIRAGARLPSSDDVAFVDVVIRTPRYEGYPDVELPDLNAERPQLEPIWNPSGAPTYELVWVWPGQPNASFIVQEAGNPALADGQTMKVEGKDTRWRPSGKLTPGRRYYRVRAMTRRGVVTPWSELREARIAHPPPPAPSLMTTDQTGTLGLGWETDDEAVDFVLEESRDKAFSEPTEIYTGRGTTWSPPGGLYTPGTYYYRVRAISDGGPGEWSAVQSIEIKPNLPPRPHLASAMITESGDSYELRWQAVPGAQRYELEETEQATGKTQSITVTGENYQTADLAVGEYTYRVRGCHDFGCGEWSNEQTVLVGMRPPASAPALNAEPPDADDVIRLRWEAVDGAEAYIVQAAEKDDFQNARLFTQSETAIDFKPRQPGDYFFRVCAENEGGEGPWSDVCHVFIAEKSAVSPSAGEPPLTAPRLLPVNDVKANAIFEIEWTEVSGCQYYELQEAATDRFEQGTTNIKVYHPSQKMALPGRPQGRYFYRVRAVADENRASLWSMVLTLDVSQQ